MPAAPPTHTLDASPYLVAWVAHAVPELGPPAPGKPPRVFAQQAPQDQPGPHAVYARTGRKLWGDQRGPDGLVSTTFQLEVFSRLRPDAEGLAARVYGVPGDESAVGLLGFRGLLSLTPGVDPPPDDPPARLWVQWVTAGDGDREEYDRPAEARPFGWFASVVVLTVHHETKLR